MILLDLSVSELVSADNSPGKFTVQRTIEFPSGKQRPNSLAAIADRVKLLKTDLVAKLKYDRRTYEQACDSGEAGGCTLLGIHEIKVGNSAKASRILTDLCNEYDPLACLATASLLFEAGEYQSSGIAFEKACKAGVTEACNIKEPLSRRFR